MAQQKAEDFRIALDKRNSAVRRAHAILDEADEEFNTALNGLLNSDIEATLVQDEISMRNSYKMTIKNITWKIEV